MKKEHILKPMLILIGFIIVLGMIFFTINQSVINSYDGKLCVSPSIKMSKKNNLYLGVYKPLKDSVSLKDKKIKAINIWTEKRWRDGHSGFFYSNINTESGFNLIIPYKTNFDTLDYFVEPPDRSYISNMGGQPGLGFVFSYSNLVDTIKLYIQQRKNNSWEESVIVDSINYKRSY